MKKFCLMIVAVFMVHLGFAGTLPYPPLTKQKAPTPAVADSVDTRNTLHKEKTAPREALPEKKKHYRKVVIILV